MPQAGLGDGLAVELEDQAAARRGSTGAADPCLTTMRSLWPEAGASPVSQSAPVTVEDAGLQVVS